ncbi:dihydrodipicolinate synthase family protein [Mycobacterium sp. 21AC1]|uniref:DUF993 family protein n=1 Tax=[Mycobacterium] appelbergii TaxID=2939269 RepID=UPI0029390C80|nr:DUF993 family protein [Mycobacterium sp. 21AC1]MDV3124121.1 dihydrodipicolinate synthase family protein [Mycobacterium sp. 21AC1]
MSLSLPASDGSSSVIELTPRPDLDVSATPPRSRTVYAASHVVADPVSTSIVSGAIDWEATLSLRRDIWSVGLGIAESMDTAQRSMGLTGADAMELARLTLTEDPRDGGGTVVGVNTDQLKPGDTSLDDITGAYAQQLEFVESLGGTAVIMASRHLAATARTADDYLSVYSRLLANTDRPVILHWLGSVFDPALDGYWGDPDPAAALETVLQLISQNASRIAGIKISLLDPRYEIELRQRIPSGIPVFTGDDFNYTDMIAGDGNGHSHALLGAFAALAPWASAALKALDSGDENGFRTVLGPTEQLSRLIFQRPTQYYKVGIAWLAYLTGKQSHFRMLGGLEAGRDLSYLAELIRCADAISYFPDPEFTEQRARMYFAAQGLG